MHRSRMAKVADGLRRTVGDGPLYSAMRHLYDDAQIVRWIRGGRPTPPPGVIKRTVILDYARRFGLRVLVETGTLHGDTVAALRDKFDRVYSVELDDELFELARSRFRRATNVTILHGDSGKMLPGLLDELREPAIFWLDGHYSGGITAKGDIETPLRDELRAVLSHSVAGHVTLIDDARLLGSGDYPPVEALVHLVHGLRPDVQVDIAEDIVRICPGSAS